ncbi:amino acid ABC transporter permease [Bradyrhizobium iriomotense]|uniref:Ectoine/hydroxyectoine ABC transporter permease subunit EhuD n=1 Tax=Bradyrhizobium iriomotense TaxID=441950 RepID=A0ABQ6BEQ8_9BRAD|nr:ABC transporter permease subunit [Bradyrhizobium iriomotense]GLR92190.1 ectoine/hydroxyectoine ABC transporter permease subunit EhuD [Bradyrhizobium iriomotense]
MTWDWNFVLKILPRLMDGVWYTVLITLASSAIALGGGLVLAILETVSTTFGQAFVRFWLELFRGVPTLVLLYFTFYVLPEFGIVLPAVPIGIAVLGIVYAAYCSEVYRGSLITIPAELRDACVALHLSPYITWQRVLAPLMIKRAAPALLNYVLGLFRETAVLFALGVPVLMGEAHEVGYENFRFLEPYTLAGVIYLGMNLPFLYLLSKLKDKHA